jgi:hypothetical protein
LALTTEPQLATTSADTTAEPAPAVNRYMCTVDAFDSVAVTWATKVAPVT